MHPAYAVNITGSSNQTSYHSTVPGSCKITNDHSPVTTDQSPVPGSKVYYACVCDVFNSPLLQQTNEVELVEGYGMYVSACQTDRHDSMQEQ